MSGWVKKRRGGGDRDGGVGGGEEEGGEGGGVEGVEGGDGEP